MIVRLLVVLECKSAVRHVVEVLEPFKVRDGHTTSVDVQVRDDQNVLVDQDFVSGRGSGSVSSLSNDLIEGVSSFTCKRSKCNRSQSQRKAYLGLDLVGISFVDGLLHSGRNKDIAFLKQKTLSLVLFRTRESNDVSVIVDFVVFQSLGVDSVLVVNGAIVFSYSNTDCASSGQVTAGVETHVTESLKNNHTRIRTNSTGKSIAAYF